MSIAEPLRHQPQTKRRSGTGMQRPTYTLAYALITCAVASLFPASAHAIDPCAPAVAICEWPTSVSVGDTCSGVLVAEDLVITAAHCVAESGSGMPVVSLGERIPSQPAHHSRISECSIHPDGEFASAVGGEGSNYKGVDLAVCTLETELPSMPFVPIMPPASCESSWLSHEVYVEHACDSDIAPPGTFTNKAYCPDGPLVSIVAKGLGCADGGPGCESGTKRRVAHRLSGQAYDDGFTATRLHTVGDQAATGGTCETQSNDPDWSKKSSSGGVYSGDSGGPLYIETPDASWRLIGVQHGTGSGGATWSSRVAHQPLPPFLSWLEAETGADLSPCHTRMDGGWIFTGGSECVGRLPTTPDTSAANKTWAGDPVCGGDNQIHLGGGNDECAGWQPNAPNPGAFAPLTPPPGAVPQWQYFATRGKRSVPLVALLEVTRGAVELVRLQSSHPLRLSRSFNAVNAYLLDATAANVYEPFLTPAVPRGHAAYEPSVAAVAWAVVLFATVPMWLEEACQ